MADLTYVEKELGPVLANMGNGGTSTYLQAMFKIVVSPDSTNSSYTAAIYPRFISQGSWTWRGESWLRVSALWTDTNNKSVTYGPKEVETQYNLQVSGAHDSGWFEPAVEFTGISATGVKQITFNITLDMTRTACLICSQNGDGLVYEGPGSTGGVQTGYDHNHYNNFTITDTINVESIPLISPPVLGNIKNTNPLNNNQSVSASTNSISLSWVLTGGNAPTKTYYSIGSGWKEITNGYSYTLTGLTAGTDYSVSIYGSNDGGSSIDNYITARVRTRYATPNVSVSNNNKLNSQSGVSASTSSITVTASNSASNTGTLTWTYRIKTSSGSYGSYQSSATFNSLSAGTTYIVEAKATTVDGDSHTATVTIRTKHAAPVVTLEYVSSELEALVFKWTSDKSLKLTRYKVDSGNWVDLDGTGTSGTFTVSGFIPGDTHVIYFRGISTDTYDAIISNQAIAEGTTLEPARITNIGEFIFGLNASIDITHVSKNTAKLKIWATGNSQSPEFEFAVTNGTYTFTPTQDQLDKMYKCFTNTNSIPLYLQVYTVGTRNWYDTKVETTLQLTGIAKTAHVGINNTPRRAQCFWGVDNAPRRAVAWIGVDNKPRRCI